MGNSFTFNEEWDTTYMHLAQVVSQHSTIQDAKEGCLIISPQNSLLCMGHNGIPREVYSSKYRYADLVRRKAVMSAEFNAINNAEIDGDKNKLDGGILYLTTTPVNGQKIIEVGIKEVIYLEPQKPGRHEQILDFILKSFDKAGIKYKEISQAMFHKMLEERHLPYLK